MLPSLPDLQVVDRYLESLADLLEGLLELVVLIETDGPESVYVGLVVGGHQILLSEELLADLVEHVKVGERRLIANYLELGLFIDVLWVDRDLVLYLVEEPVLVKVADQSVPEFGFEQLHVIPVLILEDLEHPQLFGGVRDVHHELHPLDFGLRHCEQLVSLAQHLLESGYVLELVRQPVPPKLLCIEAELQQVVLQVLLLLLDLVVVDVYDVPVVLEFGEQLEYEHEVVVGV